MTPTFDDALTLREADSVLDGHPNPALGFPFFDAATGSLGQGLSVAAGLACAARLDKSDKKIYCVIGDGELGVLGGDHPDCPGTPILHQLNVALRTRTVTKRVITKGTK